jgi:hypothetical protein
MADARYLVDIILKARDDTSNAVRSATGNLKDLNREIDQQSKAMDESSRKVRQGLRDQNESFRKANQEINRLARGSEEVLKVQSKLEDSAKAAARAEGDLSKQRANDIQNRRQSLVSLNKAERDLVSVIKRRGLEDKLRSRGALEDLKEEKDEKKFLEAATERLGQAEIKVATRSAESSAKRVRATSLANSRFEEQERILKRLASTQEQLSRSFDVAKIRDHKNAVRKDVEGLRRLGMEGKEADRVINQVFDDSRVARFNNEQDKSITKAQRYLSVIQQIQDRDKRGAQAAQLGDQVQRVRMELESSELRREAVVLAAELEALFSDIDVDLDVNAEVKGVPKVLAVKKALGKDVKFDVEADVSHLNAGLRQTSGSLRNAGRALKGFFADLDQSSNKISSFDNLMRGLAVLLITVFLEPLIQVAGAAAGALIGLATSAATAGAALGGILAAGAAQAIPVVGILFTAVSRLTNIFDALKQSNLLEEQQSYAGDKAANRQASAIDGVTSANEGLISAQQRVVEAQKSVTQARADARRQLQDLALAERGAELGARRAALSQKEAQKSLREAIATGASADEISERRLSVDEAAFGSTSANLRLRRARQEKTTGVRQGVEGSDQVQQANKGLEDARKSVASAQRSLKSAQRSAQQAVSGVTAAQGKLAFLMAQLSGAEKELFMAIKRLTSAWKGFAQEAAEPLIREFSRGVNRVAEIIQMPEVLASARRVSTDMAAAFRNVFDAFTSQEAIEQMTRITEDSRANLEPLSNIVANIGKSFMDVAEAAGPAWRMIIFWIESATETMRDFFREGRESGELTDFFVEGAGHLMAWVDLLWEIIQLFASLAVAGGADMGLSLIQDMADAIDRAGNQIRKAGSPANEFWKEFFRISREMLDAILPIFGALAVEFRKIFNDDGVKTTKAFTSILVRFLIPAMGQFIRAMGEVVRFIGNFLEQHPRIASVLSTLLGFSLLLGIFGKFSALFGPLTNLVKKLATAFGVSNTGLLTMNSTMGKSRAAFATASLAAGGLLTKMGLLIGRIPGLRRLGTAIAAVGTRWKAAGASAAAAGTAAGGGGAAAGAAGGAAAGAGARRSLLRRFGPGALVVGATGAAVAAGSRGFGGDSLRDVPRVREGYFADAGGRAQSAVGQLKSAGSSLAGLRFGDAFKQLSVGKNERKELDDFAQNFDKNLRKLVATRNVKGLENLGKETKELAEVFPSFGKAFEDAAGKIDQGMKDIRTSAEASKDVKFFSGALESGGLFNLTQFRDVARQGMKAIDRQFREEGPARTKAVKDYYQSQLSGIRDLYAEDLISHETYQSEIERISRESQLKAGENLGNLGKDLAQKIEDGKDDRKKAIEGVLDELALVPPEAQKRVAEAISEALPKDLQASFDVQSELRFPGLRDKLSTEVKDAFKNIKFPNVTRDLTVPDDQIDDASNRSGRKSKSIGEKIRAGIKAGIGTEAITGLIGVVSKAFNDLMEWLGIRSPSKRAAGIGANIIRGFREGIKGTPLGGLVDVGARIVRTIARGIRRAKDLIADAIRAVMPKPVEEFIFGEKVRPVEGGGARVVQQGGNALAGALGKKAEESKATQTVDIKMDSRGMKRFREAWADTWANVRRTASRGAGFAEDRVRAMRVDMEKTMFRLSRIWHERWFKMSAFMHARVRAMLGATAYVRDMRVSMEATMFRLSRIWHERWFKMSDYMHARLRQMLRGTIFTMDRLMLTIYRGMKYIGDATNRALKTFDVSPIKLSIQAPRSSGGEKKASGGFVNRESGGFVGKQGERGKDAVHTILGRGEAVLNWGQQKVVEPALRAVYGMGLDDLFRHRKGAHAGEAGGSGLAKGGYVQGASSRGLTKPARALAQKLFDKGYSVTSAFRSTSNTFHGRGGALDFGDSVNDMGKLGKMLIPLRSKFAELFGPGGSWKNGKRIPQVPAHMDHWHVAVTGGVGGLGSGGEAPKIPKLKLRGPDGKLKDMGQAVLDKVRKAAQRRVDKTAAEQSTDLDGPVPGGPNYGGGSIAIARTIVSVGKALGAGAKTLLAAIETGIVESGLRNLNFGDRDSLGVFQQRPSQGWGSPSQVRNVRYAATQFFNRAIPIARRAGSAGQLAQSVQRSAFPGRYDQVRAQALAILKRINAPGFAKGGEIPGSEGEGVPILAHAKEWVLNQGQQGRVAKWLGTSRDRLKSMLGFGGRKTEFAGGGEVSDDEDEKKKKKPASKLTELQERLKAIREGDYDLPTILPTTLRGLNTEFTRLRRALKLLAKNGEDWRKRLDKFTGNIEGLTGEGGLLEQMSTMIEKLGTDSARRISLARAGLMRWGRGASSRLVSRARPLSDDVPGDAVRLANMELEGLLEIRKAIKAQREAARLGLRGVEVQIRRLRRGGVKADEREDYEKLMAQRVVLRDTIDAADSAYAENMIARGEQFKARFQAQTQAALKPTGDRLSLNEYFEKMAGIFGRGGASLNRIIQNRIQAQTEQLEVVTQRIADSRAAGYDDLAEELIQQSRDLRIAIQEGVAAQLENSVKAVNDEAGRQTAGVDFARRLATLTGDTAALPGLFSWQSNALTAQANGLMPLLNQANAQGNVGLAQELNNQIADLQIQVREAMLEQVQAMIEQVDTTFDRSNTRIDLSRRLATVTGNVGALSRIFDEELNAISAYTNQLTPLLERARAQGNLGVVQEITDKIAELRVKTQEVILEMMQARITEIEAAFEKRNTAFELRNRVAEVQEGLGQRLPAARSRRDVLAGQRTNISDLIGSLENQRSNARDRGLDGLVRETTQKIDDLRVQLQENALGISNQTVAIRQVSLDLIEQRQNFQGGIFSNLQSIIRTVGEATGSVDLGAIAVQIQAGIKLLTQSGQGLRQQLAEGFGINLGTASGMELVNAIKNLNFDSITQGMTEAQRTQFESLVNAIISNEQALLENTNELNKLSNPTAQSFSSTAFKIFRQSILTGSGGLLPQYGIPQMHTGGLVTKGGMFELQAGEKVRTSQQNDYGTKIEELNVNVTSPTEVLDGDHIGRRLGFVLNQKGRR